MAGRTLTEPTSSTDWRTWRAWGRRMAGYARRWAGVATIEVTKRVGTAECLDRERQAGRIR